MRKLLWNITWLIWHPILVLFTRFEVRGAHHLQGLTSPVIIAANHANRCDPYVIGAALPFNASFFPIRYLTAKEYMDMRILGPLINAYGGISLPKSTKREIALRAAVRLLEEGQTVGIFPEGKLSRDGILASAKPGVAYLGLETGLPVLPVSLSGTFSINPLRLFTFRNRVVVSFAEPVMVTDPDLQKNADEIMRRIKKLYIVPARVVAHGKTAKTVS